MRTTGAAFFVALAMLVPAAPAAAADSGVKGRVLDTTCLGPCSPTGTPPRPYGGEAKVVVKRAPGARRVAGDEVDDGRFRAGVRPGEYTVRVKISDPCWAEDKKTVTVSAGKFTRVALEVENTCIL